MYVLQNLNFHAKKYHVSVVQSWALPVKVKVIDNYQSYKFFGLLKKYRKEMINLYLKQCKAPCIRKGIHLPGAA
jgi:hypothetical protein